MRNARSFLSVMTVALVCSSVALAEDCKSGLQVGEHAGVYHVKDVTGPAAGKSICYR